MIANDIVNVMAEWTVYAIALRVGLDWDIYYCFFF